MCLYMWEVSFHGYGERRKGLENSREGAIPLRPHNYQGKLEWAAGLE